MVNVLKYHREKEHGLRAKVCNLCGKKVTALKRHTYLVHTSEKNLQCDKCDYRCRVKSQLTEHMKIHQDPEDRKYKCHICTKVRIV